MVIFSYDRIVIQSALSILRVWT